MELFSALRNVELFNKVGDDDLKKISAISLTRTYKKGDALFEEDAAGEEFFIVLAGCIAINKNVAGGRKRNLGNLRSGEIFGEISLFDTEPRSANAEAVEDSEVLVMPNKLFLGLLSQNCSLAAAIQRKIIAILCKRLRTTDDMLNEGVIWGFRMES